MSSFTKQQRIHYSWNPSLHSHFLKVFPNLFLNTIDSISILILSYVNDSNQIESVSKPLVIIYYFRVKMNSMALCRQDSVDNLVVVWENIVTQLYWMCEKKIRIQNNSSHFV